MSSTTDLQFVKRVTDKENLNYVVRAKIYPEDPDHLFLTMRGRQQKGAGGGLSVFDVSSPTEPKLVGRRFEPIGADESQDEENVWEGQDRKGDILVVLAIHVGRLYVFDVSDPASASHLSTLALRALTQHFAGPNAVLCREKRQRKRQLLFNSIPVRLRLVPGCTTCSSYIRQDLSLQHGTELGVRGGICSAPHHTKGGTDFLAVFLWTIPCGLSNS